MKDGCSPCKFNACNNPDHASTEALPSAEGYAFNFGNRVKIKHGFYDQSLATVKRVDEDYREFDGKYPVHVKLYGVQVDGDETKTIQWFKAHLLDLARDPKLFK